MQIERARVTFLSFLLFSPEYTRAHPLRVLFRDCINIPITRNNWHLRVGRFWRPPPRRKPKTSLRVNLCGVCTCLARYLSPRIFGIRGIRNNNKRTKPAGEVKYEVSLQCVTRRKSTLKYHFTRKLPNLLIYLAKILFLNATYRRRGWREKKKKTTEKEF